MTPAQPILIGILALVATVYLMRLRSRFSDALVSVCSFGFASLLVSRPDLATRLARMVGIGRGVDLVFYISIPTLLLLNLVLFSHLRETNLRLTAAIREMAISNAQVRARRKDVSV